MAIGLGDVAGVHEVVEGQGFAGFDDVDARGEIPGAREPREYLEKAAADQVFLGHLAVLAGGSIRVDVHEVDNSAIGVPDGTKHDVGIELRVQGGAEQRILSVGGAALRFSRGVFGALADVKPN
ncbi:MAG: hypothetical protein ABSB09_01890 [Acidimicrobiales bacterium]